MIPEMRPGPDGWATTRLDRVASVHARIGWKALTADEYVPDGFVFLSTPNIKADTIDFENVNYITAHRFDESPELKLEVGDVLLVKDGNTLGITNVVRDLPRPATVNGSIAILRTRAMHPPFLRYVLASDYLQGRIDAYRAGMGVPHLFQADIRKFPIPEPPLPVQRAIADYLDAETARIDRLITNRQRLQHLQEERLASLVANLLSQQGEPRGLWMGAIRTPWPVVQIGLFADVFNGTTPEGIEPYQGDIAWVTSGDIDQGMVASPSGYVSESTRRARGMRIAPPGSVLVGLVGQGRTRGLSAQLGIHAVLNQNLGAIVPRDSQLNVEYIRLLMLVAYEDLRNGGRGANQAALNCEILRSYSIPLAPAEVQAALVRTVSASRAKQDALAAALKGQIDLLIERRQALITAAVTGQMEIPGAAA